MKNRYPRVSKTEPEMKTGVPFTDPLETILNVLNRDQRTIFTINRNERRKPSSHRTDELDSFSAESLPRTSEHILRDGGCGDHLLKSSFHLLDSSGRLFNKTTTWNRNRNRNRDQNSTRKKSHYLDGFMSRLGEVFIVGVCLLTIVRVPAVMSAPSTRHIKTSEVIHTPESSTTHSHKTGEEALSYIYPCGKSFVVNKDYTTTPGEIDEEFFKRILIATRTALTYTLSFRDRYILETFHLPFEEHHNQWKNRSYDWLPNNMNEIPKRLGHKVEHYPSERDLDQFLVNIYEYLQRFAIGLEQIVFDQKRENGDFVKNFGKTEIYLRNVLCGILMAMSDRKVTPKEHVSRSIMGEEFRQITTPSHRNLRDWLIFRDLMNCLEYMDDVFTFIDKKLSKSSTSSLSSSS